MIERLGYVGIALDCPASTNRTCRLANATPRRVRELIAENLAGLESVLRYNVQLDITLFRVSSQVIPFGSHPVNTIPWWEEFAPELARIGAYAIEHGMRLTMHPGQYTVISSSNPAVVANAARDLAYHVRFLDALEMDRSCKVTIHGGGVYGDKTAASARFARVYETLSEAIHRRLILENDERSYSAQDVLAISQQTGIPIVFDALHDAVNPSPAFAKRSDLLAACFATWQPSDGRPLTHFSTQDPHKQAGAHAEGIDPAAFLAFARDTDPYVVDCVLEAKGKERALVALRRDLEAIAAIREGIASAERGELKPTEQVLAEMRSKYGLSG